MSPMSEVIVGVLGAWALKASHGQVACCRIARHGYREAGLCEGGRAGRMPASSMLGCGSDACYGQVWSSCLLAGWAGGFIAYCCGVRVAPWGLGASYQRHPAMPILSPFAVLI